MYVEQSERSGGGRIIARQSVSADGECKFPFAVGAFHDVVSAKRQGIVAHGQGVVVEALGALVVVSMPMRCSLWLLSSLALKIFSERSPLVFSKMKYLAPDFI